MLIHFLHVNFVLTELINTEDEMILSVDNAVESIVFPVIKFGDTNNETPIILLIINKFQLSTNSLNWEET